MDRLEHDLRDVLSDERRALPPDRVSLDRVHAGAARRRRRRTATVTAASALAVVAIAVPAALTQLGDGGVDAPSTVASDGHPTLRGSDPPSGQPSTGVTTPPTQTPPVPVGPAWGAARVSSVTATSTRTLVVLGLLGDTGTCRPPNCLRLAESHDGGATFTALAVPHGPRDVGLSGVTQVRFGSATDGWLFDKGLWGTHDGGHVWTAVPMPGPVTAVAAAKGTAWALVSRSGDTQELWSSPVSADAWKRVDGVSVHGPGDIALLGGRVVVVGIGDPGTSTAYVGDAFGFTKHTGPCEYALEARLSGSGSLWATCVTGSAAYLSTSADGITWRQVSFDTGQGAPPNSMVVGARRSDALVSLGVTEPMQHLTRQGDLSAVATPPPTGHDISYIGFTSDQVGVAVVGGHLYRTTDGGTTWQKMSIG